MGYSSWGLKELDMTEQLTLSLSPLPPLPHPISLKTALILPLKCFSKPAVSFYHTLVPFLRHCYRSCDVF